MLCEFVRYTVDLTKKTKKTAFKGEWLKGFVLIPYFIWLERNGRKFEGVYKSVEHCFAQVKSEISCQALVHSGVAISILDLVTARSLGFSGVQRRPQKIFEVFWCPPQARWMKLNLDGCSIGNPGKSRAGSILCNEKAEVVENFRKFLGTRTNFEAKFLALMIGIELAKHHNVQRLWIECDSVEVVTLFQKMRSPWIARQRWMNCVSYLEDVE
ncbi:uncharacterized protein LOC122063560 [Macadamia integrifolia]|uniref:uncharacterized protein LOC122063560 n=1 Tax=Macadamia integrifolia TaxID=60698 RepID=UPI001C4E6A2C|nr:uncharacterized protein LOC122063560 [Macadamia integrifolia]